MRGLAAARAGARRLGLDDRLGVGRIRRSPGGAAADGTAAKRSRCWPTWTRPPPAGSTLRFPTEERAIRAGAASLRSALLKPVLQVTDVDLQGNARRSWMVHFGDSTDEQLPEPGATLPGICLAPVGAKQPQIRIDGAGLHDSAVPLRALADIMDSTQRLWNALAQAIEAKPTQRGRIDSGLRERALLSAATALPGSFLVESAPADEQLYARSAAELRSLVLASEGPRQLRSKIRTTSHTRGLSVLALPEDTRHLEPRGVERMAGWCRVPCSCRGAPLPRDHVAVESCWRRRDHHTRVFRYIQQSDRAFQVP